MSLFSTRDPANFSNDIMDANISVTKPNTFTDQRVYTAYQVNILVVAVLGIILNVFVLTVFCLHKKACNVAEIYLSNLAAADLLLMVFLPFWAHAAGKKFIWPFGNFLCKVVNWVVSMNAYSSIYFLVAISIDRYLALAHPLSHKNWRRPRYAKLSCVLVWALGLLLSSPMLIYRKTRFHKNVTICTFNIPHYLSYSVSMILIAFIIPLIIILFFTAGILRTLRSRLPNMNQNMQLRERKASVLIFSVLLAFFICWLPFNVLKIVSLFRDAGCLKGPNYLRYFSLFNQIFSYLAFFNSVINPLLYVIAGKNFRKKVKELFTSCRKSQGTSLGLLSSHTSKKTEETVA